MTNREVANTRTMAARPHVIDGGQFASFRRRIAIASRIGKSFDAARAAHVSVDRQLALGGDAICKGTSAANEARVVFPFESSIGLDRGECCRTVAVQTQPAALLRRRGQRRGDG